MQATMQEMKQQCAEEIGGRGWVLMGPLVLRGVAPVIKDVRMHVRDAIDSSTRVSEVAKILGLGLSLPQLLLLPPMSNYDKCFDLRSRRKNDGVSTCSSFWPGKS